jgi:DNA-binding CsgD family transcriptional regulator
MLTATLKNDSQEVVALTAGGITKAQIARQLNIGEASVYRILATNKKNGA